MGHKMAKQTIRHGATIDTLTPEELAEIFDKPRPNVVLGLGGGEVERLDEDTPMRGTRRQITSISRNEGSDNFPVAAATFVELCRHNPGRIAGSIVNVGTNPVYVYLAPIARLQAVGFGAATVFTGYLTPNGSFDFKLTNDVWCGPVTVYSVLGTTLAWGVI